MNSHILFIPALVGALFFCGCDASETPPATPSQPASALKPNAVAVKPTANEPANRGVWPADSASAVNEEPKPKEPTAATMEEEKEVPPEKDPPIPDSFKALNKDKTIFFEKQESGKRRVHVIAEVCLRDGPLEVFLCKKNTKEHEAVLAADVDAREIHLALIAAGAKFGSTVKFRPDYIPAKGDVIKVFVTFNLNGKLVTRPAQDWVQQFKTKKEMAHDWVFAGSRFFKDPDDPQKAPFYCANNGEVISIANFPDSMLDLPVKSSKEESELGFRAWTERIPPLKTKVIITLEVQKTQ